MRTALLLILLTLAPSSMADAILEGERAHPVVARQGMVVSSHFLATDEALNVLRAGGNAIDAAVTAAFALAVTQPRSGNIGGGGFMLIASNETGRVTSIDYREKAPAAADRDMFLDADGNVDKDLSRFSHRAAGVPGTVAGLAAALESYGTISLSRALAPAIRLAREGFVVTERFSDGLKSREKSLRRWPASAALFYKPDGSYLRAGRPLPSAAACRNPRANIGRGTRRFLRRPHGRPDRCRNGGPRRSDHAPGSVVLPGGRAPAGRRPLSRF